VTHDEPYMRRHQWPKHSIDRALAGAEAHGNGFRLALEAGVRIVNGADLNPIADTAIPEIEWVVRAGMSTKQALEAPTRTAPELMGVLNDLGTAEVGKLADLIVVQRNPLDNISHLRDLQLVFKEGTLVVDRRAGSLDLRRETLKTPMERVLLGA